MKKLVFTFGLSNSISILIVSLFCEIAFTQTENKIYSSPKTRTSIANGLRIQVDGTGEIFEDSEVYRFRDPDRTIVEDNENLDVGKVVEPVIRPGSKIELETIIVRGKVRTPSLNFLSPKVEIEIKNSIPDPRLGNNLDLDSLGL